MATMNRRDMMLLTGFGALAAAIPLPDARADRTPRPAAPTAQGNYLFHDEFDGPAGSAPDPSKWAVANARETMKDPTYWERPENVGQYRDDRQNVFLDGNSNLVLKAAKDGNTYFSGKVQSPWRGGIGHTWEARIKLNCLTAGCWPAFWLGNDDHGEIDMLEWYGNGTWPSATTVHTKPNGAEWATHNIAVDGGW
ncbi:MAG: glycoside hydrolase family 16 protein, partial [Mycobacterium sp.]